MGEVAGYVTRSLGGYGSGLGDSAGVRASGSVNAFMASRASGVMIGSYGSARAAQRAVESSVGGGLLRWIREDQGAIENYRGEFTRFWPGDLGDLLVGGGFWRGDIGLRLAPTAAPPVTTKQITRWAARLPGPAQLASAANLAAAPLYADGRSILTTTGRAAARFTLGSQMSTTLTAIAPPFTFFFAVTYRRAAPARREIIFERSDGGSYRLGVTLAGRWHMVTPDGSEILGPTAQDGETAILHVEQSTTGVELFLNGTSIGTDVDVPVAQNFCFSSLTSGDDWEGDLFEVLFLPRVPSTPLRTMILNYYFDYYGIEP